jgi:hypothetical protein
MELICPHCQQKITVADSVAGQTTSCPKCSGPFTAPLLPSPMAPAGNPSAYTPAGPSTPTGDASAAAAAPSTAGAAPGPGTDAPPLLTPTTETRPRRAIVLEPRVVRWIAPACLVANFFLLFFPWVGVYIGNTVFGGTMLARQAGGGIAFGLTPTRADEKLFEPLTSNSPAILILLYFLLMLAGLVVVAAFAAISFGPPELKRKLPHWSPQLLQYRSMAVVAISVFAFLCVELHRLFINFPIENAAQASAKSVMEDAKSGAEATRAPLADMVTTPIVQRTGWFSCVAFLNWLAMLGSLADVWLERRGQRAPPELILEW